jgi:hypothetical protein
MSLQSRFVALLKSISLWQWAKRLMRSPVHEAFYPGHPQHTTLNQKWIFEQRKRIAPTPPRTLWRSGWHGQYLKRWTPEEAERRIAMVNGNRSLWPAYRRGEVKRQKALEKAKLKRQEDKEVIVKLMHDALKKAGLV